MISPMCYQTGKCFARNKSGECTALMSTAFKGGKCPFQKPEAEITNGKAYPYDPCYANAKGVSYFVQDKSNSEGSETHEGLWKDNN